MNMLIKFVKGIKKNWKVNYYLFLKSAFSLKNQKKPNPTHFTLVAWNVQLANGCFQCKPKEPMSAGDLKTQQAWCMCDPSTGNVDAGGQFAWAKLEVPTPPKIWWNTNPSWSLISAHTHPKWMSTSSYPSKVHTFTYCFLQLENYDPNSQGDFFLLFKEKLDGRDLGRTWNNSFGNSLVAWKSEWN